MKRYLASLTITSLLAFGVAGCALIPGDTTDAQHGMTHDGDADTDTAASFDANDVMFAQMMLPHHQQAIDLATLAETNTTNPRILDLASRIKAAQSPEIDAMTGWLESAGVDMEMGHTMPMPGIVSEADMNAIRAASGAEFDGLFLVHMIAHHQGAIEMAKTVLATTTNDEVVALANEIITAQQAEIDEMNALLG